MGSLGMCGKRWLHLKRDFFGCVYRDVLVATCRRFFVVADVRSTLAVFAGSLLVKKKPRKKPLAACRMLPSFFNDVNSACGSIEIFSFCSFFYWEG